MAVLRQQLAFIHTMLHSGLVTETEADLLNEPVDEAMRVDPLPPFRARALTHTHTPSPPLQPLAA